MSTHSQLISHQELLDTLSYDAEKGEFTWRARCRIGVHRKVGTINQGRLLIRLGGRSGQKSYFAHRLAWFYCFGEWPVGQIDHIDGDPLNNRLGNLRDVSDKTNKENIKGPRKNNRLGVLGVRRHFGKFVGQIKHNYKLHTWAFSILRKKLTKPISKPSANCTTGTLFDQA